MSENLSVVNRWAGSLEEYVLDHIAVPLSAADDDLVTMGTREGSDSTKEDLVGTPLDDYYSRSHIRSPVPLVVGGSDGSGTRAFADVLAQLGVPMLIDDGETYDVHGGAMFGGQGWPPLASSVLQAVRSASYEFSDLPTTVQRASKRELQKLHDKLQVRHENLLKHAGTMEYATARHVTFGYKAPVTMVLVPLLVEFRRPMKYLHVVRDGRDIALSKNQSPVKKFYNDMYPNSTLSITNHTSNETMAVAAMQLWNDWNTQLLEWERSHANSTNLDYLVMRTEDFLHPKRKFESLMQLADFVGSPMTQKELCCMSRRAVVDLGLSPGAGEKPFNKEQVREWRDRNVQRKGQGTSGIDGKPDFAHMTYEQRFEMLRKRKVEQDGGEVVYDRIGGDRPDKKPLTGFRNAMAARVAERNPEKGSGIFADLFGENNLVEKRNHRRLLSWLGERIRDQAGEDEDESLAADRIANTDEKLSTISKIFHEHSENKLSRSRARSRHNAGGLDFKINNRKLREHEETREEQGKRPFRRGPHRTHIAILQRYGKWTAMFEDHPELAEKIYEEGFRGLAAFGYEPRARFQDHRPNDGSGFRCDETVVCAPAKKKAQHGSLRKGREIRARRTSFLK